MSRYIDADAFERAVMFSDDEDIQDVIYRLRDFPTADVVEVVRCKDCKHAEIQDYAPPSCRYCCKYSALYHAKNFYCSMGERREDERLNKKTGCD